MTTAPSSSPYVGFWRRFGAYTIDGSIVAIFLVYAYIGIFLYSVYEHGAEETVSNMSLWISIPVAYLVLSLLMEVIMHSFWGATFGKLALDIKVVDEKGEYLTIGASLARFFIKFVTGYILMFGCVMAAFNKKKKALHDMAVGSVVIFKG